jgi:hypothetical protein
VQFPIGSFVPHEARRDIHLAILVEVADRHALAAELWVELPLRETNGRRIGRERGNNDDGTGQAE